MSHFFGHFVNFRSSLLRKKPISIYIFTATRITSTYLEIPTLIVFEQAKHKVD